jgi:hypothetical protein
MVPALKKTFVVVALLVGLMALTVSGARDCQGWVGSSFYDLAPLERELRGQDLTTNGAGNTYFYSVCGVVSTSLNCQTVDDMTPAVCQRDIVGQYLDCGSQRTARFEQLPGGGESDGFSLSFSGGRDGRESRIHFQWYISAHNTSRRQSFAATIVVLSESLTFYCCCIQQPDRSAWLFLVCGGEPDADLHPAVRVQVRLPGEPPAQPCPQRYKPPPPLQYPLIYYHSYLVLRLASPGDGHAVQLRPVYGLPELCGLPAGPVHAGDPHVHRPRRRLRARRPDPTRSSSSAPTWTPPARSPLPKP